jgi:hypothetical protein
MTVEAIRTLDEGLLTEPLPALMLGEGPKDHL